MFSNTAEQTAELTLTREFHAPREAVWKAWTDRDALANWWGPKGMNIEVVQFDPRPGKLFLYRLTRGDGTMWGRFEYREVTRPERLVFVNSFSDSSGGITRAPFAAQFPLEIMNTLTLKEADGKTRLTLRGTPVNATPEETAFFASMLDGMRQGFGGTFDQLEQYLQSTT